MIYEDFATFTKDQEHLVSLNQGPNYIEGSLIMKKSTANNWRSSFFSILDEAKINSLASKHGIVYSLEVVNYYDESNIETIDKVLGVHVHHIIFQYFIFCMHLIWSMFKIYF